MNVLLLGDSGTPLSNFLLANENVYITKDKINMDTLVENSIDFIMSYNYPYIIKEDIINRYENKIINLHISMLPWNRGADPNFWSFVDDTPKGVTIHRLTKELDKGDILLQKEIFFSDKETLSSTYNILQSEIQKLFIENWDLLKTDTITSVPQIGKGSYHKKKDKDFLFSKLTFGWETTIKDIKAMLIGGNSI